MPPDEIVRRISVLTAVFLPFFGTLYAIWLLWERAVNWNDLILLLVLYTIIGLGVTVGFHRMLTHRSFRPSAPVKFVLLALGTMGILGPAIPWAAIHIKHHALADREGDPHSPVEGFWHAHMGWFLAFYDDADPQIYCPHLLKDRQAQFFTRTAFFWSLLALAIPFAIGGWRGLLWGGLVRIFLSHHVAFSVNSICHTFGRKDFQTTDRSRNQWVVGVLGFGEGWHNNHHAFPRSAFHGLRWWQVDLSGYLIWLLERLRLATDVYRVPSTLLARRAVSSIDAPTTPVPDMVASDR
jgi:stearoyl-CoA desaturase (delta-9 desaturase)